MIQRLLLGVDDTGDSLAAARLAIQLAAAVGGQLRAVHVRPLSSLPVPAGGRGPQRDESDPLLRRVAKLAAAAGVDVETQLVPGDVARRLLDLAAKWPADLIIIGRAARTRSGEPYVGSMTRHILEFAEQPVLVVPRRPA